MLLQNVSLGVDFDANWGWDIILSKLKSKEKIIMALSDTQVYIALVVALFSGIMALRLSTELYK